MKKLVVIFMLLISFCQTAYAQIDHIVVVILENTNYSGAIAQKNLLSIAKQGLWLTNSHAVTHPSQGNYVAMVSGSLNGVTGDGKYDIGSKSIVDLLEAKGLSWKVYAEGYPRTCFTGMGSGKYVRKHNPLISFTRVRASSCGNIVDNSKFGKEPLSNFVMYVPDLNNDGHDTGVAYADRWFGNYFMPLLKNPTFMKNTLVIVTFDESDGDSTNHIYTVLFGPMIKPAQSNVKVDHYSVMKLIEDNFNLGNLGLKDKTAVAIPQ